MKLCTEDFELRAGRGTLRGLKGVIREAIDEEERGLGAEEGSLRA